MKTELYKKLFEIFLECSEKDWDGYHANPADPQSFAGTIIFLNYFPSDLPLPDLMPEPNGDLCMVWKNNGYTLMVSVCCLINWKGYIKWNGILPEGHKPSSFLWTETSLAIPNELIIIIKKLNPNWKNNNVDA